MSINRFLRLFNLSVLATIVCLGIFALDGQYAEAATRTQIQRWILEEAEQTRVPASLALAIAKVESNFQDGALGQAGERGVMQIMPSTAMGEFGVNSARLWDGRLNVKVGISYLERLNSQYGGRWDLAISHYNGGTLRGRGANAVAHSYTRKYVANVMRWWAIFERRNVVAKIRPSTQVAANIPSGEEPIDYWMFDDPEVEKGWRHYVDVASYWLKSEDERAQIYTKRRNRTFKPTDYPEDADSADHMVEQDPLSVDSWQEMRPSDRLKQKTDRLRRKFRRHFQGRRDRWYPIPSAGRAYEKPWLERSFIGHHPEFS